MGTGDDQNAYQPTQAQISNVSQVSCGGSHTAFINDDHQLFLTGSSKCGELGKGKEISANLSNTNVPTRISFFNGRRVRQVASGSSHILCLAEYI